MLRRRIRFEEHAPAEEGQLLGDDGAGGQQGGKRAAGNIKLNLFHPRNQVLFLKKKIPVHLYLPPGPSGDLLLRWVPGGMRGVGGTLWSGPAERGVGEKGDSRLGANARANKEQEDNR